MILLHVIIYESRPDTKNQSPSAVAQLARALPVKVSHPSHVTGNTNIENPAIYEVQSVLRFLNAKNVRPTEIYRQIVKVCGEGAVN